MSGYLEEKKHTKRKKVRISDILAAKGVRHLSSLTCYDASMARILEHTELDFVLVGDSLGHTVQGEATTIKVTIEDLAYHTRCVAQALKTPLLVTDMPFATASKATSEVMEHAALLMRAGAEAVKIEGATEQICQNIRFLTEHGIPVMGHIGLIPQSIHALGGYKIQGKTLEAQEQLIAQARALESAGCFAIVLELMESASAAAITHAVRIPTIGIGSGQNCDGQILVVNDMLGMNAEFQPKFLKRYAQLEEIIQGAVNQYCCEVVKGEYPQAKTPS